MVDPTKQVRGFRVWRHLQAGLSVTIHYSDNSTERKTGVTSAYVTKLAVLVGIYHQNRGRGK